MAGLIFLGILTLLVIYTHIVEYIQRRKILGDLTGKFKHKKSPTGTYMEVQVKYKNKIYFRKAMPIDIAKLKQIRYIK